MESVNKRYYLICLLLSPTSSLFLSTPNISKRALNTGFIKLSNVDYTVENDHILSLVKYKAKSLVSILAPFGTFSLLLMLFGLILISFSACKFKQIYNKATFNDVIWYLATVLIKSPDIMTKKDVWRLVGISWTLGVYLLQQLFVGDMYPSMALTPDLDVVDNLADLAQKTTGPLSVFVFVKAMSHRDWRTAQVLSKYIVGKAI